MALADLIPPRELYRLFVKNVPYCAIKVKIIVCDESKIFEDESELVNDSNYSSRRGATFTFHISKRRKYCSSACHPSIYCEDCRRLSGIIKSALTNMRSWDLCVIEVRYGCVTNRLLKIWYFPPRPLVFSCLNRELELRMYYCPVWPNWKLLIRVHVSQYYVLTRAAMINRNFTSTHHRETDSWFTSNRYL